MWLPAEGKCNRCQKHGITCSGLGLPSGKSTPADLKLSTEDRQRVVDKASRLRETGMTVAQILELLEPPNSPPDNPQSTNPTIPLDFPEASYLLSGLAPSPFTEWLSQGSSQLSPDLSFDAGVFVEELRLW